MNVIELLDKAKKNAGIETDYALAQRIGASRSMVSHWRKEISAPEAEGAMKLAVLAGEEPLRALAICEFAKTRKPEKMDFWRRVANENNWRKW
ncbi:MAG: hypothetical protein EAZ43_11750 [Betaproteobacteria bacterium]|nr:MAG: hypothetical protein EAZ43_11750 [Betaproteobacteria bacterium]